MKSIVKEAGFADKKDDEYILGENLIKNQKTYLQRALETSHIRGRATDNKRAAAESIVTSLIATPENVTDTPKKEVKVIKKYLNLAQTSAKRLVKKCAKKRLFQKNMIDTVRWSSVSARRKYSKISSALKERLHNWILCHPHVMKLPYYQDTLLWKKIGVLRGYGNT